MSNIVVTGSANGLGAALVVALHAAGHKIYQYDIADPTYPADVLHPEKAMPWALPETLDILINCAGINGINWLADVTEDEWDHIIDVNVKGIFKMTQHCLPMLKASKGTVVNIVSNAAHMPMRCSAAYNASKGAALILTKQLARELSPDITVFSISPNKLHGTVMSKGIDDYVMETRGWTREEAVQYQLAGILSGEETPPEAVAEFIAYLLQDKAHHKCLTGTDIPYGA